MRTRVGGEIRYMAISCERSWGCLMKFLLLSPCCCPETTKVCLVCVCVCFFFLVDYGLFTSLQTDSFFFRAINAGRPDLRDSTVPSHKPFISDILIMA